MKKYVAMVVMCLSLSGCLDTATGERVGSVVAFGKHGVLCPTWEGEIIKGGINGGSGSFGQPFWFTVEDPKVVEQIQEALDQQKEIKLHFHREAITFCRSESGDDFVDSVEVK